ncbi:MAG: DoxX family protein, partial [Chitinophagaceae bacterium]|nr:DoxX family protein [Chitinophagaceae bacterium]
GLAYKMDEFFQLWRDGLAHSHLFTKNFLISTFYFLERNSLLLSVVMITLEIVAGVALLIGWMRRFILYLLLVLIVFFTFLTGYAYLSGKFTDCGCFGECLPITPLTSFIKDVVLLLLIILLIIGQKYITPLFTQRARSVLLTTSVVAAIVLQWYVLNYLPLVDCLPFRKGNNIAQQMKMPSDAMPDSFAIKFIYERNGKRYEFAPEELPADLNNYKFIDRTQKLVRKGNAQPPIKGFSLAGVTGTDSTEIILNEPVCLLLFCQYLKLPSERWNNFRRVTDAARIKKIPVYIVTASSREEFGQLAKYNLNVPVFSCDLTAIKTAARTNPTLFLLQWGTVKEKYSFRQFDRAVNDINSQK